MDNLKKLTKALILVLLLDAGLVFILQLQKSTWAWVFIATYWGVLTVKNFADWLQSNHKEKEDKKRGGANNRKRDSRRGGR